jgi:hypothetical protein
MGCRRDGHQQGPVEDPHLGVVDEAGVPLLDAVYHEDPCKGQGPHQPEGSGPHGGRQRQGKGAHGEDRQAFHRQEDAPDPVRQKRQDARWD